MTWLWSLAHMWQGGPSFNECEHARPHARRAAFTRRYSTPFTVYQWPAYADTPACVANDEVSKSIAVNGGWEFPATDIIHADLAAREPGYVLDFGAQIGWYSILAAGEGHDVLAIDAEIENLYVLGRNAVAQGVADRIVPCRGWIAPDTLPAPLPDDDRRVRLIKADVEGAEDQVIRICMPLLEERLVDMLLVEVSPIFVRRGEVADHYPETIRRLLDCGYRASLIPANVPGAELRPLDDPVGLLDDIAEEDFLFTLED